MEIWKDYPLGDMVARYVTDGEKKQVGLMLLPADMPLEKLYEKEEVVDSLVQVKLAGDIYNEAYALGNSMRACAGLCCESSVRGRRTEGCLSRP